VAIGKQPRGGVPFELGVSDHSTAYKLEPGENVAQFEVRKTLILLGNSAFGIPFFEPGGATDDGYFAPNVRRRDEHEGRRTIRDSNWLKKGRPQRFSLVLNAELPERNKCDNPAD